MDRATAPFGRLLRHWRTQRGTTQLALALQAGVSTRHLSWLENGRSEPSRAMVLRLAEHLSVPLRERNVLLEAAGYAPLYTERRLTDPALGPAREALQRLLDAHEPWPALAVDRHWQLVASNRLVPLLMASAAPALLQPPVNLLRLMLHPQGLAPMVVDLPAWREHLLARLQRQLAATGDAQLRALLAELRSLQPPAHSAVEGRDDGDEAEEADDPVERENAQRTVAPTDVAAILVLASPLGRLRFITTITVFGAPHDVTVSELAVETLLPADAATADILRGLQASLR